ncbi:MAG: helix-turn-helix transcriptional regulator [Planctomycetota bacterium]
MTSYREIAPPPALARLVECFWTSTSRGGGDSHRVLPDGCIDILFDLESRREPFVVGTMTRAEVVVAEKPSTLLGVRFRPGGAAAWLGVPAHELTDGHADVGQLVRRDFEWRGVIEGNVESAVSELGLALMPRAVDRRIERRVSIATERLLSFEGSSSIATLASDLGMSRQHLARLFAAHVGISPKLFARIQRLQTALFELRDGRDLTSIALHSGYSDQPHLNLDCRELAGVTPLEWLAEKDAG